MPNTLSSTSHWPPTCPMTPISSQQRRSPWPPAPPGRCSASSTIPARRCWSSEPAGGVGLFLLQLASAQGIKVIGVGQERNHDLMRSHGATACVDYRSPDAIATAVELAGGAFDSIADLVGGPLTAMAQPHLRADGTIAAIAAPELAIDSLIDANQSLHGILIRDNGERVRQLG